LERDLVRHRIIRKKGSSVVIMTPRERRTRGSVDATAESFPILLDGMHTAMLVYQVEGGPACGHFLNRTGLLKDGRFKALLRAMLNAVPRTTDAKGAFLRPEAEYLERIRAAFFEDIPAPAAEDEEDVYVDTPLPHLD